MDEVQKEVKDMKKAIIISLFALLAVGSTVSADKPTQALVLSPSIQVLEHGGGCRKSSPPGQCCHKNHTTGLVHCH